MEHELPAGAGDVADAYPEVWDAYAALGSACAEAGSLDLRERRLVKLAMAVAVGSEGATHSHTRRGLEEGIEPDDLRHVAMLAVTTLGFPRAVAALSWIEDVLDEEEDALDDDLLEDDED
ncbi:MAG: carboxymuconolactone decarboxylase family protein [Aquisalimonadaceae bacterium]